MDNGSLIETELDTKWFETWFDSKYYHLLYQNRDEEEAELFIDNLLSHLKLEIPCQVLDIACGKGRHAKFLHEHGHHVIGIDLSDQNIKMCLEIENQHLKFYKHDMRKPVRINYFDLALNLFTSFGYFSNERHHIQTIASAAQDLKKGGYFVLDYFNSDVIKKELVNSEKKEIAGIDFTISKSIIDNQLIKNITINDNNSIYNYSEKVMLFNLNTFESFFKAADLEIIQLFGDYHLSPFDISTSPRLILLSRKK